MRETVEAERMFVRRLDVLHEVYHKELQAVRVVFVVFMFFLKNDNVGCDVGSTANVVARHSTRLSQFVGAA